MEKIKISEDIVVYQFNDSIPEVNFGLNITVIYDRDDFVLIDTGYEHHITEIAKELDFSKCKYIICTHFHPDHIFGAFKLLNIPIIGSKMFEQDINATKHYFEEGKYDFTKLEPQIKIDSHSDFSFGKHRFTFIHNPGHSMSSMLISLNNKYLFIGDDLMYTNNGERVIPIYFSSDNVIIQESYHRLSKYGKGKTIIPGQGLIIEDNHCFAKEVKQSELYLDLVLRGVPFNELAEEGFSCIDVFSNYHKQNIELFKKL